MLPPIGFVHGSVGDTLAAGGGVDELAVAGVDADVGGAAADVEEDQIAGAQVARINRDGLGDLAARVAGDGIARFAVGVVDQAAAVEPLRGVATVAIGGAEHLLGDGNGFMLR